jgi:hypothetical protein
MDQKELVGRNVRKHLRKPDEQRVGIAKATRKHRHADAGAHSSCSTSQLFTRTIGLFSPSSSCSQAYPGI